MQQNRKHSVSEPAGRIKFAESWAHSDAPSISIRHALKATSQISNRGDF